MVNVNFEKFRNAFYNFEIDGKSVKSILDLIEDYDKYREKLAELLDYVAEDTTRVAAIKKSVNWDRSDGLLTKATLSNRLSGVDRENFIDFFDEHKDDPSNTEGDEEEEANDPKTDAFEDAVPRVSASDLANRSITKSVAASERNIEKSNSEKSENSKVEDSETTSLKTQYFKIDEVEANGSNGELDKLKNEIEDEFTKLSSVVWTDRPFNLKSKGADKAFKNLNVSNGISIKFSDPVFDWEQGNCKCSILAKEGSRSGHDYSLKVCIIGQKTFKPSLNGERRICELFEIYRKTKSSTSTNSTSIYLASALKIDGTSILAPKKQDFSDDFFNVFVKTAIGKLILRPFVTRDAKIEFFDFVIDYTWLIASHPAISPNLNRLWNLAKANCEKNNELVLADEWLKILSSKQWQNAIIYGVPIVSTERTRFRNLIVDSFSRLEVIENFIRPIIWLFGPFAARFTYVDKPNVLKKSTSNKQKQILVVNALSSSYSMSNFVDWFARVNVAENELDFDNCEFGEYFLHW